jgi:hypothetical protein
MGEPFQVQRQTSSSGAALEPPLEFIGVTRREQVIADFPRKLYDCLRPQASVKVIVKQDFGEGPECSFGNFHGFMFF